VPRDEILRVLVPGGTAVYLRREALDTFRKPWPTDIDEWTHFLHGPDNNAVANDSAVGPPTGMQWAAGPAWSREHDVTPSIFAPVSAKGRLFYILDEGPVGIIDERVPETHSLVARDAFNGTVLWKRPLTDWYSSGIIWGHIPVHMQRRLVAVGNRVYVTLGLQGPVTALDAATGETIRDYRGTERASEIVCDQGILAVATRTTHALDGLAAGRDGERFRQGYPGTHEDGEAVVAVDADTGQQLWRREGTCLSLTLALSGGKAFLVEEKNVVCLDARTGDELWRTPFPARTLVVHGDIVLGATDRDTTAYAKASKTIEVAALSVADGAPRWRATGDCLPNFNFFYHPVDLYVAQGVVWVIAENLEWNNEPVTGELLGLSLENGEVAKRLPLADAFTPGHHVRCYKGKATEKYLLFNKRGIEFIDIESGAQPHQCHWVRGACRYGILPCNGLIYAPSHACACYPGAMLQGFYALTSQTPDAKGRTSEGGAGAPGERLEHGPAYGQVDNQQAPITAAEDWPTYRHDAARSGSSTTMASADLEPAWQVELGGKLSAPTVADGRAFVAEIDAHTVHAFDADTGHELWHYVAAGRVDSPPTIYGKLVVFGSRDGWVTCLRAVDGEVVWRFRAAPDERRIGALGQLESPWPVHGSVLVEDGIAYVAAGRSSFLDGGIRPYGLSVSTGEVVCSKTLGAPQPDASASPITAGRVPGAVPDILVSDGTSLYMRHVRLDRELSGPADAAELAWGLKSDTHLLAGSGLLDGSLFNRTIWQYGRRVDRSQLLVFDGGDVYGFRVYSGISWNCPVYKPGDGYVLFRQDVSKPVPKPPKPTPPELNRIPYERYEWHQRVPIRVSALALAPAPGEPGRRLFVAGSPDTLDPADPLAAFEGRAGGKLWVLSGAEGRTLAEYDLGSPPVWNGLALAQQRLYLSTRGGKLLCMETR